jgi:hypothetical protein
MTARRSAADSAVKNPSLATSTASTFIIFASFWKSDPCRGWMRLAIRNCLATPTGITSKPGMSCSSL